MKSSPAYRSTLLTGIAAIIIALLLIPMPLFVPLASIAKYVMTAGFLLLCFGMCCLLMGVIDWIRSRS
jgi:hypothetical protein